VVHLSDLSVGSSDFQEALARRLLFLGSWVVSHVEGSGEVSHSGEQVQAQDALRESQKSRGLYANCQGRRNHKRDF